MKQHLIFIVLLQILVGAFGIESADKPVSNCTLSIDGASRVIYSHEYPANSKNTSYLIHAQPLVRRLEHELAKYAIPGVNNNPFAFTISGMAGSEAGDPLLNAFLGTQLPNRDHFSRAGIATRKAGFAAAGSYLYEDRHSDRFDSIWNTQPMAYEERGLAEELAAAFRLVSQDWNYTGTISSYGYWALTPVLYSPLFIDGLRSEHLFLAESRAAKLDLRMCFDSQNRYYDHDSVPTYLNTPSAGFDFEHAAGNRLAFGISSEYDAEKQDPARLGFLLRYKAHTWTAQPSAGIFSNGKPIAGIMFDWNPVGHLSIDGTIQLQYESALRNMSFKENGAHVEYRSEDAHFMTAHLATGWGEQYESVLSGRVWYDMQGKSLKESIYTQDTMTVRIIRRAQAGPVSSLGASAALARNIGKVGVTLGAAGHQVIDGPAEQFSVLWSSDGALKYGSPDSNSLFAAITIRAVGPVSLIIDKNDTAQALHLKPNFSASISSRIPFTLPFTRAIVSSFACEAGPFFLTGSRRQREHPAGNQIGTRFAIRFDFSFSRSPSASGIQDVSDCQPGTSQAFVGAW